MTPGFDPDRLAHDLRRQGLSPLALIPMEQLPERVMRQVTAQTDVRSRFQTLLLAGHSGSTFWRSLSSAELAQDHPFDTASRKRTGEVLRAAGFVGWEMIYPADGMVPLQQLGALAGWHYPSPLGLGVHPEWGPWFAYRAVVLLRETLPALTEPLGEAPCSACELQPCRAACPAGALQRDVVEMELCLAYRLGEQSDCAETCLARCACPVGEAYRYDPEQIRYHYRHSLEVIRRHRVLSD